MASRTSTSVATPWGSDDAGLLPAFVASASTSMDRACVVGVRLPPALTGAAPKRQREFLAGRACAAAALTQLGMPATTVDVAAGGAPAWPHGIVGSITHTDDFAWAAAARDADAVAVGIDAEPVMPGDRALRVAPRLATAHELARAMEHSGFDRAAALTLVFSAKEAFYKCLYPEVGRVFDYLDARVEGVDPNRGRVTMALATPLAARWHTGATLEGRFVLRDGTVRVAFVR